MTVDAPGRQPSAPLEIVGQRVRPASGVDKCVGSTHYAPDIQMEGTLWLKLVRSPHARARIVSVDVQDAWTVPGVEAIFTHHDVPGKVWGDDRAKDMEGVAVLADEVHFAGESVAAVAASDVYAAEDAASRIRVEYEVLKPILDPVESARPEAVQIHPYGNVICGGPGKPSYKNGRGNLDQGFAEADAVIERVFRQPAIQPVPHEPRGCLAHWDGETLTVWDSTQMVFRTRAMLAFFLDIPEERIRVLAKNVGGSFGAKDPPSRYTLLAALASLKTGKPVKAWLTREEETVDSHMRAAVVHEVKAGITRDGRITAMKIRSYLDNGYWGGMSKAPATGHSYARALSSWTQDMYKQVPNWDWEVYQVRTNRSGSGPVRARTSAEALFPVESTLNDLAAAVGIDPCDLRIRHCIRTGQIVEAIRHDGWDPKPISKVGYVECLQAGREAIGWEHRHSTPDTTLGPRKRGVGVSGSIAQAGTVPEHVSLCEMVLDEGEITLFNATPDQGSEQQTTLRQIAAEVLKTRYEAIKSTNADSSMCLMDSGPVASRTVFAMGTAVSRASENLRKQVITLAAEMAGVPEDELEVRDGAVWSRTDNRSVATLSQISSFAGGELRAQGRFKAAEEATYTYGFAASFVEVEVDVETGQVHVLRVVSSHDAGRAINPEIVEGQVEGGVAMGLGYALSEGMVYDSHSGVPLNQWFLDLKTPGTLDTPAIQPILIELGNDAHPFGAKGCSEISLGGVAPAIRNAVYNATGALVNELPITPDRVLAALRTVSESQSPS